MLSRHGDQATTRSLPWLLAVALAALMVLAAACADGDDTVEEAQADDEESDDEQSDDGDGGAAGDEGAADLSQFEQQAASSWDALEEVRAEVDGLDLDERQERLIELAQEEGGEITFYSSANTDEIQPVLDAFEDATDVDVNLFRSGSGGVAARLTEESEAGLQAADVVLVGTHYTEGPQGLVADGLFHEMESPYAEQLVDSAVGSHWLASYLSIQIPIWNTDVIEEGPEDYTDMFTNFATDPDIEFAHEVSDPFWFANIIEILVEHEGHSEEEAVDILMESGIDTAFVRGSTTALQLVGAGQYDMHSSVNHHGLTRVEGAPVDWEPAPQPLLVQPQATGIVANTENPAGAQLLLEFLVSLDGQEILAGFGRTAANTGVEGGFPFDKYQTQILNFELMEDLPDKWEPLWEDVVNQGTLDESAR